MRTNLVLGGKTESVKKKDGLRLEGGTDCFLLWLGFLCFFGCFPRVLKVSHLVKFIFINETWLVVQQVGSSCSLF